MFVHHLKFYSYFRLLVLHCFIDFHTPLDYHLLCAQHACCIFIYCSTSNLVALQSYRCTVLISISRISTPYSGKLLQEKTITNWWKIWFSDFHGENFRGLLAFDAPKDTTPLNFTEKTFANSHKTVNFAKFFSLKVFPVYSSSSFHMFYRIGAHQQWSSCTRQCHKCPGRPKAKVLPCSLSWVQDH